MATIDPNHLSALLAKYRASKAPAPSPSQEPAPVPAPSPAIPASHEQEQKEEETTYAPDIHALRQQEANQIYDRYGNLITLNEKQASFVSLAAQGNSCVLIGAAGTGKTTCQKAVTQALSQSGFAGILQAAGHSHLTSGTPGIVICAYTRRATSNIRKNVSSELQSNCVTIHKLLEYQPVYYEIPNEDTGETRTTMRFEPTRNAANPLPPSIKTIIIEEASMVGTDLHAQIMEACPHNPQIIYLGDIQQLPPVFGSAILGYKLQELPVVELTEVYRQALESPIISLAHRILSGRPIPATEYTDWHRPGKLKIHPWKKRIDDLNALMTLGQFFAAAYNSGAYIPDEDMILIPYNKACGTIELNKLIANHIARKEGRTTYQIIAGFQRCYLSPGDRVLYEKEDAIVLSIEPNPAYFGADPLASSTTLDYWGYDSANDAPAPDASIGNSLTKEDGDVDFLLAQVAAQESGEDRVRSASHIVTLKMSDSDTEVTVSAAGEINSMLLGYAITVHKAQGSEARKVFLCIHQSHAKMIQRELLYTAVTRAREELYVICEPDTFTKGIINQRIIGNTLAEKAEYFKGKIGNSKLL
jgi:exodeoxyribonuclease V alpha subunit